MAQKGQYVFLFFFLFVCFSDMFSCLLAPPFERWLEQEKIWSLKGNKEYIYESAFSFCHRIIGGIVISPIVIFSLEYLWMLLKSKIG